jgi:hypothetical protein
MKLHMSFPRLPFIVLPLVVAAGLATGACGVPLAVSGAGYAADGGLLVASDKTAGDHMISMVSKQDCALWRVIRGRAVCKQREGDGDPYKVDYDDPQRMVGEDGVHYAPPLRAAADAPPSSWDAAAYRSAPATPAPPTPPAEPVTAVAQGSSDAPSAELSEPPAAPRAQPAAKPAKPKTRSVKKPSRRPAAPAS